MSGLSPRPRLRTRSSSWGSGCSTRYSSRARAGTGTRRTRRSRLLVTSILSIRGVLTIGRLATLLTILRGRYSRRRWGLVILVYNTILISLLLVLLVRRGRLEIISLAIHIHPILRRRGVLLLGIIFIRNLLVLVLRGLLHIIGLGVRLRRGVLVLLHMMGGITMLLVIYLRRYILLLLLLLF
mmetsp:Transcript_3936/g.603  ORF Transcript_3936/g.603 Transcript_3936/m.603 type:complete len:183 (+) Transcript_3936:616-1164(+)